MITAPLPRASPSGSGRLSMIIPQNHGLTITYNSRVSVIPEVQPRENWKRESYNERITHTSI